MNEINHLSCIELEPALPAQQTIIWLHGLGADGSDFVPIVDELKLPISQNMRFIFPHAPLIPVTINNGYEMRAWYDIYAISIEREVDSAGIATSVAAIHQLIEREMARGVASNHILLAGFSQGAAIALTAGLGYAQPLAGIIALSGYLPATATVLEEASKANRHIPIFLAHGTQDPVVPYALGKAVCVALKGAGYPVDWHSYPMVHSVCGEEINDLSTWIRDVMPK